MKNPNVEYECSDFGPDYLAGGMDRITESGLATVTRPSGLRNRKYVITVSNPGWASHMAAMMRWCEATCDKTPNHDGGFTLVVAPRYSSAVARSLVHAYEMSVRGLVAS